MPLRGELRSARGNVSHRDVLVVRLTDSDGLHGYAEAAAMPAGTYVGDDIDETERVLRGLSPQLCDADMTIGELLERLRPHVAHSYATAAIEGAFWHLLAQRAKAPLWRLWGGTRTQITYGTQLGIEHDLNALVDRARQRVAGGASRIRLKVTPGWDREPITALRSALPDVAVIADANGSYDEAGVAALAGLGLSAVEQPLDHRRPDCLQATATLRARLGVAVCLDESVLTLSDARRAIETGACDAISVKAPRFGGWTTAMDVCSVAAEAGIDTWGGGLFETDLGRSFNLNLMSRPDMTQPGDGDPPSLYYADSLGDAALAPEGGRYTLDDSTPLGGWKLSPTKVR